MTEQTAGVAVRQSVIVRASQDRAFAVFTDGFASWWPLTHTIGPQPAVTTVIEPRAGGRYYERAADGSQCDWGRVLTWEPPHRVVLSWDISPDWKPDRNFASQVEVRFNAEDERTTRVELEHRGLEVYGDLAEEMRRTLGGGWPGLLERYAAAAAVESET